MSDQPLPCPQCGAITHTTCATTTSSDIPAVRTCVDDLRDALWKCRSAYAGRFDVEDVVSHVKHGRGTIAPAPVVISEEMVEAAMEAMMAYVGDGYPLCHSDMRRALEAASLPLPSSPKDKK